MHDLRERLVDRPQLSTDGLAVYQDAVEGAFGGDVDFAQVIKAYGKEPGEHNERRYSPLVCTSIAKRRIEDNPDMRKANTSYVERHNHLNTDGHGQPLRAPLQLLPDPQDASRHADDGERADR